jgi:hypothetical protein
MSLPAKKNQIVNFLASFILVAKSDPPRFLASPNRKNDDIKGLVDEIGAK